MLGAILRESGRQDLDARGADLGALLEERDAHNLVSGDDAPRGRIVAIGLGRDRQVVERMAPAEPSTPAVVRQGRFTHAGMRLIPGIGREAGHPFARDLGGGEGAAQLIGDSHIELDGRQGGKGKKQGEGGAGFHGAWVGVSKRPASRMIKAKTGWT